MKARVKVPRFITKNDGVPAIADVEVKRATRKAILVDGHGALDAPVHCAICGRELTHPVSQQVGIGPVCAPKVGVPWEASEDPEVIAAFREKLRIATTFSGIWLPLSRTVFLDADGYELPRPDFSELRSENGNGSTTETAPREEASANGRIPRECDRGTIELSDWIVEQKGLASTKVAGTVIRTTAKAVLVERPSGGDVWLPKSQIVGFEPAEDEAGERCPDCDSRLSADGFCDLCSDAAADFEERAHGERPEPRRRSRPTRPVRREDLSPEEERKAYTAREMFGEPKKIEVGGIEVEVRGSDVGGFDDLPF